MTTTDRDEWENVAGNICWFGGRAFQYRAVTKGWEALCETQQGWMWEIHNTIENTPMEGLVASGIEPTRERAQAVMTMFRMLDPGLLK